MASPFFFGCWRDRPDSNRSLDSPRSNSELALCKKNGWLKLRHKLLEASRFRGTPQFQLWNKSVLLCSHQSSGNIIRKKTTTLDRTYKTSYLRMILDWIPIKKQVSNELSSVQWSVPTVATKSLIEHVQMSSLEPVDPLKKQWVCLNMFEHVWTLQGKHRMLIMVYHHGRSCVPLGLA